MTTRAAIIDRARLELGDQGSSFLSVAPLDGLTRRFDLAYAPVEPVGLEVLYQSTLVLLDPAQYLLDASDGVITLNQPGVPGDQLVVRGFAYRYFTTDEWAVFADTAFLQHSNNTGLTYATLPGVEEYLVAVLAVIEALWALATDSSKDIDISTPEGVSVPRTQRYRQLMQMIEARQAQYDSLASALNVGLNRLEMYNLRRVSRSTGRYVPIYLDREIEDTTYPVRVFPRIDRDGAQPALDSVPQTDIVLVQGLPYELDLQVDPATLAATAQVRVTLRRYRASAAYRYFRVAITNAAAGTVTATLSAVDTSVVGGGPYWWDAVLVDNAGVRRTVQEGRVQVEERART